MDFKHITVATADHVSSVKKAKKHLGNESVSHMWNKYQLYHTQNIKLDYKMFKVLGTS